MAFWLNVIKVSECEFLVMGDLLMKELVLSDSFDFKLTLKKNVSPVLFLKTDYRIEQITFEHGM